MELGVDTGLDLKFTLLPCLHCTCVSWYFFGAKDSLQISHLRGHFGNSLVMSNFSLFLISTDFLIALPKRVRFMSSLYSAHSSNHLFQRFSLCFKPTIQTLCMEPMVCPYNKVLPGQLIGQWSIFAATECPIFAVTTSWGQSERKFVIQTCFN